MPCLDKMEAYRKQRELVDFGEEHDESERQFEYVRANGLVFRAVDLESSEGRSPKMQEAIDMEYANVKNEGSFNEHDVHEWDNVVRKNPNARKVDAHLVIGEKGIELEMFCDKVQHLCGMCKLQQQ